MQLPHDPLKPFLDAVVAYINAPDWQVGQQVVEAQRHLLLSPPAERAFDLLLKQYADQPQEAEMIQQHRAILRRCHEVGIAEAFAELRAAADLPAEVVEAVLAFLNAPDWDAARHLVDAQPDLLLTDSADAVLAGMRVKYTGDAAALRDLDQHRDLLRRCREAGIAAAFSELTAAAPPREVIEAVLAFVNAFTLEEKQQVYTQRAALLTGSSAERVFADLLEHYHGQPQQRSLIENNRDLLRRAQTEGAASVFAAVRAESVPHVSAAVVDAVRDYLAADDWNLARQIVTAQSKHLLGEAAQAALELIKGQVRDRAEVVTAIQQRQDVLRRCREVGIDAAFSDLE